MAYKFGTVSYGTTGVKTITCGFQPLMWEITTEPAPGGAVTSIERSVGVGDGTNENVTQEYSDPSRARMERATNKTVWVKKWDSGTSTYVEKVVAAFDSTTATELKLNFTTSDSNYQNRFKIWG